MNWSVELKFHCIFTNFVAALCILHFFWNWFSKRYFSFWRVLLQRVCLRLSLLAFPLLYCYYGRDCFAMFDVNFFNKIVFRSVLLVLGLKLYFLFLFWHFFCQLRQTHPFGIFNVLFELLSILLEPLNYFFNDDIRSDSAFVIEKLRTDIEKSFSIKVLLFNWMRRELQSKEGEVEMEWRENQSWTYWGDHYYTFLGMLYESYSGSSIELIFEMSTYIMKAA